MINNSNIQATWQYVVNDHKSWPLRFWLELSAWALSIAAAILFALTVPNIPFYIYLTMTITGCAIYAWSAWTRGSVGMLANYMLLTIIDTCGIIRLILT